MNRLFCISIILILTTALSVSASDSGLDAYKLRHEAERVGLVPEAEHTTRLGYGEGGNSLDFADTRLNSDSGDETFIQQSPDIVALPNGTYVVFWEDDRNGDYDIFAQLYGADNVPIAEDVRLVFDQKDIDQRQPTASANAAGNIVLAWVESDGNVYCQVFNSDLEEVTGQIKVNDNLGENDCNLPDADFLHGGSFGIVWEDVRSTQNVFCQLFTPTYDNLGGNFQVNSTIAGAQFWAPQVVAGADSGFAVTWDQITGVGSNISARTFTTGGVPKSGVVSLVDPAAASADQFQTALAHLPDVGYVASFIDTRDGSQRVFAQGIGFSGAKRGANFLISDNSDYTAWDVASTTSSIGEVVITWASYSSRAEILGALLDDQGARNGPNVTISDPAIFFDRFDPHPTYRPNDSMLVVFTDLRSKERDIYIQQLSEHGNRVGGNLLVSSDGTGAQQRDTEIAAYGTGRFAAVWTDERNDAGDIYLQVGQSNGALIGSDMRVNTDLEPALQQSPDVGSSDNGYVTVVWENYADIGNPGVSAIMGRRFNSDGLPFAEPILLSDASASGERSNPSVAQASTGRATAVWVDRRNGADDIYGQGMNATGNLDGVNFKINSDPSFTSNSSPRAGMTDANDLVIAWLSSIGDEDVVVFQLFDDLRDPIGNNAILDIDTSSNSSREFDLAIDPNSGAFVIAWINESESDESSILARRYSLDGSAVSGIVTVVDPVSGAAADISVDIDTDGNFAVAWTDFNDGIRSAYYTLVHNDNVVESVKPFSSQSGAATEKSPSVSLNSLQIFKAWSSNLVAGAGFDAYANSTAYTITGADGIDDDPIIPRTFTLHQNYPNPFNPSTTISFYLARSSEVKLEVINSLGQRVAVVEWNKLSAGKHEYSFDGNGLSSGVYFYRLTAGDYCSTRKMMLLK